MKKNLTWFDRLMMAVTFAEADEPDIARHCNCETAPYCPQGKRAPENSRTSRNHHPNAAKA